MDTFADTLWTEFAVETEEHLQAVEPILSQADPLRTTAPEIAQLFRSFHSIKGLARAMDVLGMESVAHHAENLLGLVREGRSALTADLADLLLQAVDALKNMRDAVTGQRGDATPDPQVIARLAAAFAHAGGETPSEPPAPAASVSDTPLHEDPEMLGIFVEMLKGRGADLCAALAAEPAERATAIDAAETLTHAAEVMNFDALAASFGELCARLQSPACAVALDDSTRHDLLSRLGDIRLQIELMAEITGQDAGTATFSAALAHNIGDERLHLAQTIGALNHRLRDDLIAADRLAVEADAAAMSRHARTLYGIMAALSLARTAEMTLLIEDLYGRVASGELEPPELLLDVADDVFAHITDRAQTGRTDDFGEDEAADLTLRLRALLASAADRVSHGEGEARLVAGLYIPTELLAVLSDENLADLERGILQDDRVPYEILVHLEADPAIAGGLMGWLTSEAQAITNRTVVTDGESWFEFLALSPLEPRALAASLQVLDPDRRCVKQVRRLTDTPAGELVLDRSGGVAAGPDAGLPTAGHPNAATNLIRVRGDIVDAFLDDIGELRVMTGTLTHLIRGIGSRAMVARASTFVDRLSRDQRNEFMATFQDFRERDHRLLETEELISGLLSRLHQAALELRVVPVDVVFNRLPRMVRDLAQQQGKSVELVLEGRDVRIDKSMVEALADPLIHMVRNAVDHGIEGPEERRIVGKPQRAQLTLRAAQRGSEIHIEITDDGRGLDADAIRAKVIDRGLASPAQVAAMPQAALFQFIFAAGLSTAASVTETSGRGVGMDIVLSTVRRLNGDITTRSERGKGTTFTLVLPVSAALQTALIVRVGDQSLAIPERHVMAVAEIETGSISLVGAHRSILHRQSVLPLYDLGHLLGMRNGAAPPVRELEPIVITTNGRQMIGLEVDAIEQRQELFLKDLDPRLARFPGVGGASVLGDGRVVLVLDGEELIQLAARGIDPSTLIASRLAS
ncbi:MAG TPA: chemotaxis protein CheW [Stellaceae bacterium]|jgi:chemotaxis protein histidine kinase CheA|nr:chemotaxis protein CheW [Stellaceae bacterium]